MIPKRSTYPDGILTNPPTCPTRYASPLTNIRPPGVLSDSFTLILEPFTSSTVPRREGSELDDWLCIVAPRSAKLLKKKAEIVKVAEPTTQLVNGPAGRRDVLFMQPR